MRFIIFCILALALFSTNARADDLQVMVDRLDRMERDMQNIQMEMFRGGAKQPAGKQSKSEDLDSSSLSRLDSRISAIETNMRELTGKIEETNHRLSRQESFQDKTISDIEMRLQMMEQKLQSAAANPAINPDNLSVTGNQPPQSQPANTATPPGETAATAQPAAPSDPKTDYDRALGLLQHSEYPAAESALRQFLASYPDHALAGNAQYWLGESFYVRGDFKSAAVEFVKSYKQYSQGAKAPDSLLKLGLSLANLDNKKQACASFGKLSKEFPKATEAIKMRADNESKKLKCTASAPQG